jgi:ATP-binding cassette subfamily B protein
VTFGGGGGRGGGGGGQGLGRGGFARSTMLEDGPPVPPKRRAATARKIVRFFKPYRGQVLVVFVAILITSSLGVINPILLKLLIDVGIGQRDWTLLNVFVVLMILIPIVSGLIGVGQSYLNNRIGQSVMRDLRGALYSHLQAMPLRFFTETRTGEIQSRLSNDVGGVQRVVTDTAASVTSNITVVISTVIAMIFIDWRLTLLSLAMLPAFAFIANRVGKTRRAISTETQRSLADMTAATEETLSVSGILLSKTFGQQQASIDNFDELNSRVAENQVRQAMVGRWFFALIGTIMAIIPAFVYWLAGYLAINNDPHPPTIGDIVAFTTLQSRLFFPLGQLLNIQVELQGALALFDRIFEYLEMKSEIVDAPDAVTLVPAEIEGGVRFRDVWFHYPTKADDEAAEAAANGNGGSPPGAGPTPETAQAPEQGHPFALEAVDFEVRPGELVALVGPSGAGKTTTTYLIPRLYDVDRGSVEIDGHDVRRIRLASIGEIVGFVTQETYLFHSSVRANLQYARPDASDAELEEAARAAAIHDRIMELPEGYDTIVGERGYKLSGGEKQRIAIARVLLKDPRILILDEATSALDTVSERLIQQALEDLEAGRTTIAIAHRLSTILRADQILVFDRGRVVERGTHAELLDREGVYARLYNEQFLTPEEAAEEAAAEGEPGATARAGTAPLQ